MKKSYALFLAVLVVAFPMTDLYAKGKKASTPPPRVGAPHIESISSDSVTVKNGTKSKTYKIAPFTRIELNGRKADVNELKSGMRVNVLSACDESIAKTISAGSVAE